MVYRNEKKFELIGLKKPKNLRWLRKLIVTVLAWSIYYSGLLLIIAKTVKRFVKPKAIILYYHHVCNGEDEKDIIKLPFELGVSLNLFEKQMKLLARHYKVVGLPELIADLYNNKKIDFIVHY